MIAFEKAYNMGLKKFLKISRFTPTKPLCEDLHMLPCNYLFDFHRFCLYKYLLSSNNFCIKAIIKNSLYNNDLFTKSVRDISFTYKVNSLFVLDNNVQLIKLAFMNNFLTRHSII